MSTTHHILQRAVAAGIFALGISSTAQALSIAEPEIHLPEPDYIVVDEVFLQSDSNHDGTLSVDEFYQLHTAAALIEFEKTFSAMDKDQSGEVMVEEFIRFLPGKDDEFAKQQFFSAAGTDLLMDVEEFSVMRLAEQGANTDLLWKFALLDHDHNEQLTLEEFYSDSPVIPGEPVVEPPVINDHIEPEKPVVEPEPPVIIDPVKPEIEPPSI